MSAFTYECHLVHPASAEVTQTIRHALETLLSNQGLVGVLVNPGFDHDGKLVLFSRRTPTHSNLAESPACALVAWYDQDRMLDAQGYPHAFLEALGMQLECRCVSQRHDGQYADLKIFPISLILALNRWLKWGQHDERARTYCSNTRWISQLPAAIVGHS